MSVVYYGLNSAVEWILGSMKFLVFNFIWKTGKLPDAEVVIDQVADAAIFTGSDFIVIFP